MRQALAARLLTGPLAFLLAGCLDMGLFLVLVTRYRLRRRLGRA